MDTYVTLKLARKTDSGKRLDDDYLKASAEECAEIVSELEDTLSRHSSMSDLSILNSAINYIADPDETLLELISVAETYRKLTGGAYDASIGNITALWDFENGGYIPADHEIADALYNSGIDKLKINEKVITKLDPDVKLDFSGIAKGYTAQNLLEYLNTTEIEYGIVSIGGDIGVFGRKPENEKYKIGIKSPENDSEILGHLYISSGFVSVASKSEKSFEANGVTYHHILDPKTGKPADSGIAAATVIAPSGTSADALATAILVMGSEEALKLYESENWFEAILVTDEGEIITTPGLTEEDFVRTNPEKSEEIED